MDKIVNNSNEPKNDILNLLLLLWGKRKLIIRNCIYAFIAAVVISFSIPKEYTSDTVIAPELSSGLSGISGNLGALASMAGINVGGLSGSSDAIYPEIYPEIAVSTPFILELLEMEVVSKDGELRTNLYDYLMHHQKQPWWGYITGGIGKFVGSLVGKEKSDSVSFENVDGVRFTKEQFDMLNSFEGIISVELDHKTSLITISATTQDPYISAQLSQEVATKLQSYVETYRTAKARKDLLYVEKLYKDAESKYKKALDTYSSYSDAHQNLFLESAKAERDKLENEMSLSLNVYSQMAQQLEIAKAKVQEKTPVCVVVQPAIEPFKASYPKKMMTVFIFVFLAFFGTSAWLFSKYVLLNGVNAYLKNFIGTKGADK